MTSIRHATLAVGLVALLTLSGCGNTPVVQQAAANPSSAVDTTTYPTQQKIACDLLTQRIAKSLLGTVADASEPIPESGNASVRITSCVRASSLSELDRSGAVSLVMRAAQNSTGAATNAEAFEPRALPKSGQEVFGYGEKAFWNQTVGQLNILKDGNWYVLASGQIDPVKHTVAQTKKLADALIDEF